MRISLQVRRVLKFIASRKLAVILAASAVCVISGWLDHAHFLELAVHAEQSMTLSSPSFQNGADIPKKFTCDGADVSPQLEWSGPPAGAKSFAIVTDDPDAPAGTWNHWVIWNLPASLHGLPEGVPKNSRLPDGSLQGMNDFHKPGYNGPCPPVGKPHRYYFKLFALDQMLAVNKEQAGKPELEQAMRGHILAQAEWVGLFKR